MRSSCLAIAALALVSSTALVLAPSLAQPEGRGPAENWWVNKTEGGVYKAPMRPLWKLADLKKMHGGQTNWSEQIILDPEQDATYNSAAPGTKFTPRIHPDTPTVFVVVAGEVHFNVEGQQPVTATRGSIINIMKTTIFSYDVGGQRRMRCGSRSIPPTTRPPIRPTGRSPRPPKAPRSSRSPSRTSPSLIRASTSCTGTPSLTASPNARRAARRWWMTISSSIRCWAMSIRPTTSAAPVR